MEQKRKSAGTSYRERSSPDPAEHPRPGSRPHPRLRGLPSDSALEANPAESVAACELDCFRGLTRAWIWVREASLQNPNK